MEITERTAELITRLGDNRWGVRNTWDRATNECDMGRYDNALTLLDTYELDELSEWWQGFWNIGRMWVELLRTGDVAVHDQLVEALSAYSEETDPQLRAGIDAWQAGWHNSIGRWDDSYDLAMSIDSRTGEAWGHAAVAAAWTKDPERVDAVLGKTTTLEGRGAMVDGLTAVLTASGAALAGDPIEASSLFSEVIARLEHVAPANVLNEIRVTFAMLVGQDDPAAAKAAQDAYDWLNETGTNALIEVYADGLPPTSEEDRATG
jgi:hypothetical protein